jgi:hypothetical protein
MSSDEKDQIPLFFSPALSIIVEQKPKSQNHPRLRPFFSECPALTDIPE